MAEALLGLPSWLTSRVRSAPASLAAERQSLRPHAPIIYWMRTAARLHENPALDVAVHLARALESPLLVYHALSQRYPYASDRHHTFILEGARDVAREAETLGLHYAFHLERGKRGDATSRPVLRDLARDAACVVTEIFPSAPLRAWTESLAQEFCVLEVDASCIFSLLLGPVVPAERAFAFRKLAWPHQQALLDRLVRDGYAVHASQPVEPGQPALRAQRWPLPLPFAPVDLRNEHLADLVASCDIDHGVAPVPDSVGGSVAGYARWQRYWNDESMRNYARTRNDPLADSTSRISPYLHYGHVSPFRIARDLWAGRTAWSQHPETTKLANDADKLLDELLIWRELAWHYAFREPRHAEVTSLPTWARETLREHERDPRVVLHDWDTLARAQTGDALWDACQRSLLAHGELHNNVRMTWGKKLLEWTETAEDALALAIDLNHRYALDGRDPASYGGLRWCFGAFDRPFPPARPIFGTVRTRATEEHATRLDVPRYSAWVRRSPFARPPRVLIIGAGLAGLAAARTLLNHNIEVCLLDKAQRPGGRVVSRVWSPTRGVRAYQPHRAETPARDEFAFDYGAQYFTARTPHFAQLVGAACFEGALAPWRPRLARIGPAGDRTLDDAPSREAWYVAPEGLSTWTARLATGLVLGETLRLGATVTSLVEEHDGIRVHLSGGDTLRADFVLLTAPTPQAQALLGGVPPASRGFAPCWSVTVTMPARDLGFDAARIEGSSLAWVARETSKPGRKSDQVDMWTLHASTDFATLSLERDVAWVSNELAAAFAALVDTPTADVSVQFAHRWRYARPTEGTLPSTWARPRILVAGDGCARGRVESAYLSGVDAAGALLRQIAADGAPARAGSPPAQRE